MSVFAAVVAGLAGLCFALSSVLQHHAARRERTHPVGDPRLLVCLIRRPIWLAGRLLAVAGTVLQAVALMLAPLSCVQPLLVAGLLVCVPLEARLDGRRVDGQDLRAVLLVGGGLTVFLLAATPDEGVRVPSAQAWALVGGGCAALVGACLLTARAVPKAAATWLGMAAGVVYGVSAALLKSAVDGLDEAGPTRLLISWSLYAFLVAGLLGLVLGQNAFQAGRLAAPLSAFTVAEPLTALAIGITAYQERLDTAGPNLVAIAVGVAVMTIGMQSLGKAKAVATVAGRNLHPA